jgi:hypothetical protein
VYERGGVDELSMARQSRCVKVSLIKSEFV